MRIKFIYLFLLVVIIISLFRLDSINIYVNKYPSIAVIDTGLDIKGINYSKLVKNPFNAIINEYDNIEDNNGHGTLISNILYDLTDGKIQLIPIKAFDNNGFSQEKNINNALKYAIQHDIEIILMSSSFPYLSENIHDKILDAYNKGIIIISATGNGNTEVGYPARFPEVIGVGASKNNNYVEYSNYGMGLDFLVPGEYHNEEGTSISAARLAAIISQILYLNSDEKIDSKNIKIHLISQLVKKNKIVWNEMVGFGDLTEYSIKNNGNYFNNINDIPLNTFTPVNIDKYSEFNFKLPLDGQIELYSTNEVIINNAQIFSDQKKLINKGVFPLITNLEEGEYTLKLFSNNSAVKTISQLLIRFKLVNDEYEPNDYIANSTKIKRSKQIMGTFHSIDDKDYYEFSVDVAKKIDLIINPIWGNSDLIVTLFNKKNDLVVRIDDKGINQAERIKIKLKEGNYFLLVENGLKSSDSAYKITGSW
ncbi:S8 family serine peptidase [Paenibacillus sp. NPDC058174]|uniref:S8 family peptidase n=1 Tax=Paenibacillus sp. NPDC058174 TaxID=3346366 RepID=UPI0036DDD7E9